MAQMKYFYELTISSSPHAHSPVTTQTIMRDVLIALVPALLGSIYFFGFRALLVTLVNAAACVFFEWGFCKVRKLHCKTYDLSAVVTGVLLAFVCPVTIPYWTIILGDFFAIVLVKMLFGGLGKNIVNPALAGRAFLFSWPVLMSNWVKVGFDNAAGLLSTAAANTDAGRAFRDQFIGMSGTVSVTKDGGEVDALTGATITSRAVCTGVSAALACAANLG